jgi:hypothetical protein
LSPFHLVIFSSCQAIGLNRYKVYWDASQHKAT